jgi:chromosome condensin MukBEF MukE localization factor
MSTMTEWKEKYEKERKLRQEVEGELSIIKATTVLNSPEMREAIRTIKNLETRLAEVLSLEDSHQKLNGKLQERLTEVEEDNKKLANQIDDKINQLRRSGL